MGLSPFGGGRGQSRVFGQAILEWLSFWPKNGTVPGCPVNGYRSGLAVLDLRIIVRKKHATLRLRHRGTRLRLAGSLAFCHGSFTRRGRRGLGRVDGAHFGFVSVEQFQSRRMLVLAQP